MAEYRYATMAEVGPVAWDEVAASSSGAWVWHVASVIAALATWPRHSDRSFAVLDESGAAVAIVPLHKITDRMARLVQASRLLSVGGPAILDSSGYRVRRGVAEAVCDVAEEK